MNAITQFLKPLHGSGIFGAAKHGDVAKHDCNRHERERTSRPSASVREGTCYGHPMSGTRAARSQPDLIGKWPSPLDDDAQEMCVTRTFQSCFCSIIQSVILVLLFFYYFSEKFRGSQFLSYLMNSRFCVKAVCSVVLKCGDGLEAHTR